MGANEDVMFTFILAIHIIVAIAMIGLILIQHGKGADAGASFGAGASGTVFGAAGSANFLTRATAVLTAVFFITSMILAVHARDQAEGQYTLDTSSLSTSTSAPAADETLVAPESQAPDATTPASEPVPEGETQTQAPAN